MATPKTNSQNKNNSKPKTTAKKKEVKEKVLNNEVIEEKVVEEKINEEPKNKPKKAPKQISSKTAYIILGVLIVILLLAFYFYRWYDVKKEERLMHSYLISEGVINLEINNLDEMTQVLNDSKPSEYFVLLSYTNDEDAYRLEEGLKSIINNYQLSDRFYYFNVYDLMKEDNYLEQLNNAFNTDKIKKVPTILYFKDDALVDLTTRVDDNPINAGDFQKLLDIYEFEGQ